MKVSLLMLFLGTAALVSAAPQFDFSNNQRVPYSFAYGVNSLDTGDVKEHKETSTADGVTEGEYRWLQPNGLFSVTRYTADGAGYRAIVSEEPGEDVPNYYRNSLVGSDSSLGNVVSFSNFQPGNRVSNINQNFQNTGFTSSQNFQNRGLSNSRNQGISSFQFQGSRTPQRFQTQQFTSGQRFQNPGFTTTQTFQSQGNIVDGGVIDGGIIDGGISTSQAFQNQGNIIDGGIISGGTIDGGVINTITSIDFGTGSSQFNSNNFNNANSNINTFGSTSNNFGSSFNNFRNPGFSSQNGNRQVSVLLAGDSNRFTG